MQELLHLLQLSSWAMHSLCGVEWEEEGEYQPKA